MNLKEKILHTNIIKYDDKIKILSLYNFLGDKEKIIIENIIDNNKSISSDYDNTIEEINSLFVKYKKSLIKKIESDN